jgi:hypothetical protein
MARVTMRTSTVFVATGEKTNVYRSIDEVPEPMRRRLEATTNGANSATILIADRNGREELVRAIQGQSSRVQFRVVSAQQKRGERRQVRERSYQGWLELSLLGVLAVLLWFAFMYR